MNWSHGWPRRRSTEIYKPRSVCVISPQPCLRKTVGVLRPLRRPGVGMAGSPTLPGSWGFPRERSSEESKNSITWRTIRLPDGCVNPMRVEKKIDSETPEEKNLIQCIEFRTAGDLDEEDIVYTDWSPQDLADRLSLGADGVLIPHAIFDPKANPRAHQLGAFARHQRVRL